MLAELRTGSTTPETRRELALAAFRHTAEYDSAIATYLGGEAALPDRIYEPLTKVQDLRYGENQHQSAAAYCRVGEAPLGGVSVLQGKELSYNNLVDLDGAVQAVLEHVEPAVVVVKHTNPCGVGRHATSTMAAWESALAGDPTSAFGGIVAFNRTVDAEVAEALADRFLEVIAAPDFSDEARAVFAKKKNLRVIQLPGDLSAGTRVLRHTLFGTLAQSPDPLIAAGSEDWNVVTRRAPTDAETTALGFLWKVCKHVKSNAIVIGSSDRTFGVGAGQMSRVDAVHLAVRKSTGPLAGAVLASDAFFPFRDGVDAAAEAGIRAIVQPGGSMRDAEVIAACDEHGIAMVLTGHRHFRH